MVTSRSTAPDHADGNRLLTHLESTEKQKAELTAADSIESAENRQLAGQLADARLVPPPDPARTFPTHTEAPSPQGPLDTPIPAIVGPNAEKPEQLWRVLDRIPSFAAPASTWQESLHSDLEYFRPCLRSLMRIPGADPVYEVDRVQLADLAADSLGILSGDVPETADARLITLGTYSSGGLRYGCHLGFPGNSEDIRQSVSRLAVSPLPFLLLLPTRHWPSHQARSLLRTRKSLLVPYSVIGFAIGLGRSRHAPVLDTLTSWVTGADAHVTGPSERRNSFMKEGNEWSVTYANRTKTYSHVLGFEYISQLLAGKRVPLKADDLKARAKGHCCVRPSTGIVAVDRKALNAYQQRVDDLDDELSRASANHDPVLTERLQTELHEVTDVILSATGFGSRTRRVGDESTSVRTSVKKAIDRALEKIEEKQPELARHLDISISTGETLCYSPQPDVDWVA